MAADLVPIRLSLSAGDRYTVWAPRWRDSGDEWEAFLGKDEDLFVFSSVADLVAFVRSDADNDLTDHPAWKALTSAHAHDFEPTEDKQFDLVAVEELVSEKPTEESVSALAGTLAIVSSIGSVCELAAVSKFFNGNPSLGTVSGGVEHFTGRAGAKRWHAIAEVIGRSWDDVLGAIDDVATTPDVDAKLSAKAEDELAEEREEDETGDAAEETALEESAADTDDEDNDAHEDDEGAIEPRAAGDTAVLGGDKDFWLQVGIDPIRIMTSSGTFFTLRCYLDDEPIFLGRNGRISVFPSERALARYLADEHDHDLSDLSTYDDIRTAATDGSLAVEITDDNIYVLTGLADDFADGPDAVDREQLELAVEVLRDIGDYSEDPAVDKALETNRPLGKLVAAVLEPDSVTKPSPPYAAAVREWEKLEQFVEGRLRRE
ncbi:primosomal protein [Mycobacterium marseillense]|uniref:Primosomal protein n=1 Tax=Mycobacterium marseillense TaxID=701042 RepID=A0AAC9YM30_9MYCO|nr:primosomal protein [Mycobacterium marseillense]ASW91870.1 primosomal protein [Mycobacterium marseillense]MCA2264502.1 primosomal protein [Mycobacterium marseillense]MDM3977276.1 primosomal protein [Mycobacterium marseillense]OBJ67752.1 primosomal protein [Mycobacterium marseillense]